MTKIWKRRWVGTTRHALYETTEPGEESISILKVLTKRSKGGVFLNVESYERALKEPDLFGLLCESPGVPAGTRVPIADVKEMVKGQTPRNRRDAGGPYYTLEAEDVMRANSRYLEAQKAGVRGLTREQLEQLGFRPSYSSSPTLATLVDRCRETGWELSIDSEGKVEIF